VLAVFLLCVELGFEGRDLYLEQKARMEAGQESIWTKVVDDDDASIRNGHGVVGKGGRLIKSRRQGASADSDDERIEWLDEGAVPPSPREKKVRMLYLLGKDESGGEGRIGQHKRRGASERPGPMWLHAQPTPGNVWLGAASIKSTPTSLV
jgi:hypothetical protein